MSFRHLWWKSLPEKVNELGSGQFYLETLLEKISSAFLLQETEHPERMLTVAQQYRSRYTFIPSMVQADCTTSWWHPHYLKLPVLLERSIQASEQPSKLIPLFHRHWLYPIRAKLWAMLERQWWTGSNLRSQDTGSLVKKKHIQRSYNQV